MRSLKRLKDFLTGEESEKKDNETKTTEPETTSTTSEDKETPVKAEIKEEPTVEKEVKEPIVVEEPEVKEEKEIPETEEPVVEEKLEVKEEKEIPETEEPVVEESTAEETESEPIVEEETEVKEEKPKPKGSVSMSMLNKEENLVRGEEVDNTFKQDIIDAGADTVALCYQCGTCTGSCPSGKRTPYRIRSIIRKSLMGLRNEVLTDDTIWECVTCYACQERCPRGVAIVDVVKIIRNMQSKAGRMAQAHKMTGSFVLKTGHGVPINDATMALRKRVGLNELPPTTHEYPEALEEVRAILKKTGFDTLIGYNWETGEIE
ncbi:CoB--CoM heterodisulfide reductase subunit C [Methanobacterium oryzae]|uniref:CoB--CoM heterodisulfide reductase subunit C n=1 Tax=Methanobacterium oryzae TaxID=69540 RepID=UPI003D1E0FE0